MLLLSLLLLGCNAKHHFPIDYVRYFNDDNDVMNLPQNEVLDIIEPWKVKTGEFTLHTRKVNLNNKYMLGFKI